MRKTEAGNTIKVSYVGTLQDGTVFDQTRDENYLELIVGEGQVIPGFDQAIIDMSVGETKKVTIPPEQAYGEYTMDDVIEVTRSRLPDNVIPEIGQRFEVQNRNGQPVNVTITALTDNTVTMDANHMLAGKELTFEITLQEIVC